MMLDKTCLIRTRVYSDSDVNIPYLAELSVHLRFFNFHPIMSVIFKISNYEAKTFSTQSKNDKVFYYVTHNFSFSSQRIEEKRFTCSTNMMLDKTCLIRTSVYSDSDVTIPYLTELSFQLFTLNSSISIRSCQ